MPDATAASRWLAGNFAPVTEEVDAFDLEVTGSLPAHLDGTYVRNGPNPISPDPATYHWFTGAGMVHGIRLRDGRAEWYRNRWVRSGSVVDLLGGDDCGGPTTDGMSSAPNTNVIGHAGRLFAIQEAGAKPVELTDDLDTVARVDFGGGLRNGYTAHPKRDPVTGELHACSYYWANPNVLEYSVIDAAGSVTRLVEVPVPGNPMAHDMSITATRAVLYDLPCQFDLQRGADGLWPYVWDESSEARLGVLGRTPGDDDVTWYVIDPCYVFHPLNAFDDGDDVVIDVVRHPRMFDTDRSGPDEGPPALWRWRIDTAAGTVHEERLDDRPVEFPRVDERVVGRPHRYGWFATLSSSDDGVGFDGAEIVRRDLATGAEVVVPAGPGRTAGEVVFVPRGADADELDGHVMFLVHDAATDTSELVLLDAAAPDAGPVARVHLPQRVPYGFHGNWVPTP